MLVLIPTIHDDANWPEICFLIIIPLGDNLWCHVKGTASQERCFCVTDQVVGKTEVWKKDTRDSLISLKLYMGCQCCNYFPLHLITTTVSKYPTVCFHIWQLGPSACHCDHCLKMVITAIILSKSEKKMLTVIGQFLKVACPAIAEVIWMGINSSWHTTSSLYKKISWNGFNLKFIYPTIANCFNTCIIINTDAIDFANSFL